MHDDSNAHAGKPFLSLHTYFKDLLLRTKGEGRKGDHQGAGGSRRKEEIERFLGKGLLGSL